MAAAASAPAELSNEQVKPHQFKVGDKCEALYSDNKWYRAEVQAVSKDGLVYTVLYTEYNETEIVKASSVRSMTKETLKRIAEEEAEAGMPDALDFRCNRTILTCKRRTTKQREAARKEEDSVQGTPGAYSRRRKRA